MSLDRLVILWWIEKWSWLVCLVILGIDLVLSLIFTELFFASIQGFLMNSVSSLPYIYAALLATFGIIGFFYLTTAESKRQALANSNVELHIRELQAPSILRYGRLSSMYWRILAVSIIFLILFLVESYLIAPYADEKTLGFALKLGLSFDLFSLIPAIGFNVVSLFLIRRLYVYGALKR